MNTPTKTNVFTGGLRAELCPFEAKLYPYIFLVFRTLFTLSTNTGNDFAFFFPRLGR
nr:hypothetical protein [Elizabethkingia bruuniana]